MLFGLWLGCVLPRPPQEPITAPDPTACVDACVAERAVESVPIEAIRAACAEACAP
jgi:hypothetical protein